MLQQLLGRPIDSFAYPHGYYDRTVRQLVVDAGYTSAAAVKNALSPPDDDVFALSRVTVLADFDLGRLVGALVGLGVPFGPPGERLRTRLWRQARRMKHRRRQRSSPGWRAA